MPKTKKKDDNEEATVTDVGEEAKNSGPPALDPSEYKKTVKLLKSSKIDKALEGCRLAMDAKFVAASGAIGPLMNLIIGHNKKIADAAVPAMQAVANFLDPEPGKGHFEPPGTANGTFTMNGVQLISKKSGGWKGAERIVQVLRNSITATSSEDDGIPHEMKSVEVTHHAMRMLASVVESFIAHGIGSSEENVYRQKIRDLGGVLPVVLFALKREGISESTKRYAVRLVHRLITHLMEESMPMRDMKSKSSEISSDEKGQEPPAPGVKKVDSMEPPSPTKAAAAAKEAAAAAAAELKVAIAIARANAVSLLVEIVPLLVDLLGEAVAESRVDNPDELPSPVRLANPQNQISPELELINLIMQELDVGSENSDGSKRGAIKCLTVGALSVFGDIIQSIEEELTSMKDGDSDSPSTSNPRQKTLLRNLEIANKCSFQLIRCGIVYDDTSIKLLHAPIEEVSEEVHGSKNVVDANEDDNMETDGGSTDGALQGNVSQLDFGAVKKSAFSLAAVSCVQGIGKVLACLLSQPSSDSISSKVIASLMKTSFDISLLKGVQGFGFSELLRPLISAQGCLPLLHTAICQNLSFATDAEKLVHALIVHQEGPLEGKADARVLGGGNGTDKGAWLDITKIISAFTSSRGSSKAEGDDAAAEVKVSDTNPDFTLQTRLLRLLVTLSTNQANAATIGESLDFIPIAKEYLSMRHLQAAPIPEPSSNSETVEAPQEQPQEETKGKKGRKKKKKKKKKKVKVDVEKTRLQWIDAAIAVSESGLRARGGFHGAEVAILAGRLIRNLSIYHLQTSLKLGGSITNGEAESDGAEDTHIGGEIITDLIKICSQSSMSQDNAMLSNSDQSGNGSTGGSLSSASRMLYNPCLATWLTDLQIMSHAHAKSAAQQIDIPSDIDLVPKFISDQESLQRGIFLVGIDGVDEDCHIAESHPKVFLQAEAMEVISSFARASSLWYSSAMEMAIASAKAIAFEAAQSEDSENTLELKDVVANAADIDEALASQQETTGGSSLTSLVTSSCTKFLMAAVNRTENSPTHPSCTSSKEARDLILRHAIDALGGLCAAQGGREAVLLQLGYIGKDDKAAFTPGASKDDFPFHFAIVEGIISVLYMQKSFGSDDEVTLLQQLCAVRCLSSICRDKHLEPQKQSLNSDTLAKCAIASGGLVALVALLDTSFHSEGLCASVDKVSFKNELNDFIIYLITRGECRESFYDDPSDAVAEPGVQVAQAEPSEAGFDTAPKKPVAKKKGKKGKKSEDIIDKPFTIGVDPNAGPNVQQWASVLNATGSFPLYLYEAISSLHAAVKGQHKSIISALLSAGADVNIGDANGVTPLMSSLAQGDDKVTKDLLFIGGASVNAVDRWGNNVVKYSFLSPAARKLLASVAPDSVSGVQNRPSTLEVLTGSEADSGSISQSDKALNILCSDRNMLLVLNSGADVSTCDADGNYPLHWLGRGTSLEYSFRNKSVVLKNPVVTTNPDGGYHVSRADDLIKRGAGETINGCNKFGQTALHVALASGLTFLATRLLSAGADPNILDGAQNLPLHLACVGWAPNVAQNVIPTLLRNGAGKPVKQGAFDSQNVAMGLSIEERRSEHIKRILKCGLADHVTCPVSIVCKQVMLEDLMNYPNSNGHGPFHIACGAAHGTDEPLGPASLPIDMGSVDSHPSVDDLAGDTSRELEGSSLVQTTVDRDARAKRTRYDSLAFLLSKGADPNTRSMPHGLTGLHFAARASSKSDAHTDELIVDILVNHGGDINAVDAQSRAGGGGPRYTPLHYALKSGCEDLAWHLLRVDNALAHPATANPPALLLAAEAGVCPSMIGYLVQHGGEDPNITGSGIHQGHRKYSGTSLHLAAEKGHDDVVAALLLSAVDSHNGLLVDLVRPHNGRTALHLAAYHGHLDVVKHLIEDGKADKLAHDIIGETPIASAVRGSRSEVLSYLISDMQASERADALLNSNEKGVSPLTFAEKLNIDIFKRCQAAKNKSYSADYELLDQSDQTIAIILEAIPEKRLQEFEHEHKCFKRKLSYGGWFMSGGGGGKDGSSIPGVIMADYD